MSGSEGDGGHQLEPIRSLRRSRIGMGPLPIRGHCCSEWISSLTDSKFLTVWFLFRCYRLHVSPHRNVSFYWGQGAVVGRYKHPMNRQIFSSGLLSFSLGQAPLRSLLGTLFGCRARKLRPGDRGSHHLTSLRWSEKLWEGCWNYFIMGIMGYM